VDGGSSPPEGTWSYSTMASAGNHIMGG